jgi:FlaA1/EpsC-like NDP-sugar epimerase
MTDPVRTRLRQLFDRIFLPRWIILFADLTLVSMIYMFTYLLRYNVINLAARIPIMVFQFAVSLPFFLLVWHLIKPHNSILRHSSIVDAISVLKSLILYSLGLVLIRISGDFFFPQLRIPFSIIIIQFFISCFVLISFRLLIAFIWHYLLKRPLDEMSMMIFGAGTMGQITKEVIEKDDNLHYNLVGFIDDNQGLQQKRVSGLMVYSPEEAFVRIIEEKKVKEIVIGITPDKISKERKREFVDLCIENNIRVKDVPDANNWLSGRFYASQIHDVMIEDLLGRDPIILENNEFSKWIHNTEIMVTGAAGSIGSEIVTQLIDLYPRCIYLVDQAESPLYDLMNSVAYKNSDVQLRAILADVTDTYRIRQIFEECVPDIVFHASAYKHVPLMEEHPYEALRTNVMGTKIVADLAVEYGVKKFVMISTDKAVNPTNVMGASKRICEMYCRSLSDQPGCDTKFIATRFGNVLGSSGSVIPLFRRQISQGGPVTITDKEIIRYFMTIPEACRLVLEAGFMGKGGEIYLFDMGQPVKIYDLAEKMIRLSGFIPHQDIKIVETGLRPGEKLYEELLAYREEHLPTHHEKILIATIKPNDFSMALHQINELVAHLDKESVENLVARMKEIVPEYKSQNSRFEKLDGPEEYNSTPRL